MRMTTPRAVIAPTIALLFAAGVAAQQDDQEWLRQCERQAERNDRAVFCEVRPVTLALAAGALDVDASPNGSIQVDGSAIDHVQASARIRTQAGTDTRARELAREIRIEARDGHLSSDGPRTRSREGWSVSFAVTVPGRADLVLSTTNGSVAVADVDGRIRARTTNGAVRLDRLAGDVRARATNGSVRVNLAGDRWQGDGLDLSTTNGAVRIAIPEDYSAELETRTVNGRINMDFPVTITTMGRRANRIQTSLGEGGATIRAETTNGSINLTRP